MKRLLALVLSMVLAAGCIQIASAQRRGGGMRGGARAGGGMRSAPSRPASRPSAPSGGFNFNHDIAAGGGVNRPAGGFERPGGGIERPPGGITRPPGTGDRPNRPVNPPQPPQPAWGWNGGVVWAPAPVYWGGGFWGAYGVGVATAVVFGEIVDEETHETTTSYQVEPETPGAKVLANYGLVQTKCGAPGLVVIYGPENSVVCAQPNTYVQAGEYGLDVTNLTLTSSAA